MKKTHKQAVKPLTGIYSISNPLGEIYIGQSKDIEGRFRHSNSANCKLNLNQSIRTFGIINHEYKILLLLPPSTSKEKMEWYEAMFINHFIEQGVTVLNKNKTGGRGKPKRKVAQYSLDGELVQNWDSINHAANDLGIHQGNISNCVNGKKTRKHIKGMCGERFNTSRLVQTLRIQS